MRIMKKFKIALYVLIGIILLPLAIVVMPIVFVILLMGKIRKNKEQRKTAINFEDRRSIFLKKLSQLPSTYTSVSIGDEFILRVSEFTKLAFVSYNDLSGRGFVKMLDAVDHPENKKQVLEFLRDHPIETLLNGERFGPGHDLNHWYFIFSFEDTSLNRRIDGYGWTQESMPFITQMTDYIPNYGEEEFRKEREIEMRRIQEKLELITEEEPNKTSNPEK